MRLFVDIDAWTWAPGPDIDGAEAAVLAIALGECDVRTSANWLSKFLRPIAGD